MEKDIAISVKNLTKKYKIYEKNLDMITEILLHKKRAKEKVVLNNISFDVNRGDVIGIVGSNGAGKSTLLKIIAGILDYSSGNVEINGKVSAILELGTGFHPEYTGRENIIMGGMCLGMSKKQMEKNMEAIIDFSELRDVIDEPFKCYSSGMKSRLTFATAISVEPDIFIVDEALAAGDAVFVSKCLRKMKEICESGATVLFVSHSIDLVKRLCKKAIHIEEGKIVQYGDVMQVCTEYELQILDRESKFNKIRAEAQGKKASTDKMEIVNFLSTNKEGDTTNYFIQHDSLVLYTKVICNEIINSPAILIKFTRFDGILVTSWMNTEDTEIDVGELKKGSNELKIFFEDLLLGDGDYFLSLYFFEHREGAETAFYADPICVWENVVSIRVRRKGRPLSTFFDQSVEFISVNEERKQGRKIEND